LVSAVTAIAAVLAMTIRHEAAPAVPTKGTTVPTKALPSTGADPQVAQLPDRTPLRAATLRVVRLETGEPVPGLDVEASRQSAHDHSQYWLEQAMQHEREGELLGPTDARGEVPLPGGGAYRFATRNSRLFFV